MLHLVAFSTARGVKAFRRQPRVVASEIYGLSRFDPVSFVVSAALLGAVAKVAGIRAARAARVDPVRALRHK